MTTESKELSAEDLEFRLRKRAEIRRQIPGRKSVVDGEPDRIADLLEEAANRIAGDRDRAALVEQKGVDADIELLSASLAGEVKRHLETKAENKRQAELLDRAEAFAKEVLEWCEMGCVERPSVSGGRLTLSETTDEFLSEIRAGREGGKA